MAGEAEFNLVELFWSAQGEGPLVGRSMLFLRFGGCDLRCGWCDTPGTWRPTRECRFETSPGTGVFANAANPISRARLVEAIGALAPKPGTFISLTGGEPLLQPKAVNAAAGIARDFGLRVVLETHGLAVTALTEVIENIDFVSMDWKLESDVRRADEDRKGEGHSRPFAEVHADFLARISQAAVDSCVKVVITQNTTVEELDEVCRVLAGTSPDIPLILQPVTPFGKVREQPSAELLLQHLRRCDEKLADVRLIPQTHRVYGAL